MIDLNKDRYRVFLEDIADGFFETNLAGDFKFFNNAFCNRIFGCTSDEMKNRNYRFFMDEKTSQVAFKSFNDLYKKGKGVAHSTWNIQNKNGKNHILDVSAELIYDQHNQMTGFRGIAHDVTEKQTALEKSLKMQRCNQILFRISEALHQYQRLDDLIDLINQEIQDLMDIEGAFVLLVDEKTNELYFFSAHYGDSESKKKFKEIRFPADQGVSGKVYQTGEPILIPDVSTCPFFLKRVDEETDLVTKSILSVAIQLRNRTIGVLTVVNKLNGNFDQIDIELLSTIASTIALPIENTRIQEELRKSNEELSSLNRAKDRVIHHLSHELKTPVAVLSSSLKLLRKKITGTPDETDKTNRIMDRAERNLDRLLDIQYQTEDLLKERDRKPGYLLHRLLDSGRDLIASWVEEESGDPKITRKISTRIDDLFGKKERQAISIRLDLYMKDRLEELKTKYSHRTCRIEQDISDSVKIHIPIVTLDIISEGLIKNAIENTPDTGLIKVSVKKRKQCSVLSVRDFGVGMTREKQHLIFENFFSAPDALHYATRKPYDFNAGGKGLDLLRMKIFSEKYHFKIHLQSKRCRFIPGDDDICPGNIQRCPHCWENRDCYKSGGTDVEIIF